MKKFNKINESGKTVLACYGATYLIMSTASNPKKSLLERTFEDIYIPGDWLYINNTSPNAEPFYEGENLIYLGKGQYWGTVGTPKIMTFQRWFDMVKSWNGQASSHGTTMRFPHEGISLEK